MPWVSIFTRNSTREYEMCSLWLLLAAHRSSLSFAFEARYDQGSSFRPKCFLHDDGVVFLNPKSVGKATFVCNDSSRVR